MQGAIQPSGRRPDLNKSSNDVAERLLAKARERMENPGKIWGIPWCFSQLNRYTGGIQKGEMTILAARPSVGKTTILVQQVNAVSDFLGTEAGIEMFGGKGVIKLALLESSAEVFQRRWATIRSGVSQRRILEGTITPRQYERYRRALNEIAQMPIVYRDRFTCLGDVIEFLTTGPTMVWWGMDYLQKVPSDASYGAITRISQELTRVALEVAPGLVLSQLTREVDKREDRRPQMSDLRGSGQIEADARVILGLFRESVYKRIPPEEADNAQPAELGLLKNNEGESGHTIGLSFWPKQQYYQEEQSVTLDLTPEDLKEDDDVAAYSA